MLIDNLKNLRWKCYTQEGIVEISNYRHNDTVTEQNYFSESTDSKVDTLLIDILEDLYYLVAFENIESDENVIDKKSLLSQLEQKAQRYHALLRLKQFYYTEVQMSINRINKYCTLETNRTDEIQQILREIESLYFELHDGDFLEHWDHLESIAYRLAHRNLKILKDVVNAIIDLAICSKKNDLKEYKNATIKQWMNFFLSLRNKEFGLAGELAWLLFLLNIFEQTCSDSQEFDWIALDLRKDWETQLTQKIEQTNVLVEEVFGKKIYNMQENMMIYYTPIPMSSDSLDEKIEDLIDAVKHLAKTHKGVSKKYITTQTGCLAIMHYDSERYAAVSGEEKTNAYSEELSGLLGSDYNVVDLNDDVRYYYTKQKYITYGQYKTWKNKMHYSGNNGRMFSCCEKKLLTVLYGKGSFDYTIYVRKQVCSLCKKAIEHFEKVQNCNGVVGYPQDNSVSIILTKKFDVIAKAVIDNTPPNQLKF